MCRTPPTTPPTDDSVKLQSQTEWTSSTNPLMWTLWCWRLWSEVSQVRKEAGTVRLRSPREHGMKGHRNKDNFILFLLWWMRMITDDAMDVHFSLRLFDRPADHTYCHNYPCVNRPGNCGTWCWSSNYSNALKGSVTLKYGQSHWKLYKHEKLNEQNLPSSKVVHL